MTTRTSKDLIILQVLTSHLAGITPTNGYDFDLTGVVFRGRTRFGDHDPLPALSILEAPRTEDPLEYAGDLEQIRIEKWSILIQGWVADDKTNPTDPAYELKANVEDRLNRLTSVVARTGNPTYPSEYLLGRRVRNLQFGPGIVSPPRDGISNKAFFYLPVTINRVYDPANVFVETP